MPPSLDDLARAPWLGTVGAVLTGYFGAADQVAPAARLVAAVKAANPRSLTLCDPIIGDTGGLFQPETVAGAIRDWPPAARRHRHAQPLRGRLAGPASFPPARSSSPRPRPAPAPSRHWSRRPTGRFRITHRWVPDNTVHGTGDLFAALHLGHRLDGAAPEEAAARATSAVRTMVEAANRDGLDELPLAACQDVLAAPRKRLTVTALA